MALRLRYGAVSDVGRSRKKNDDSGYAGPYLLMVADGMGGAPAGDLASAVAVETLQRLDVPPPQDLLKALAGAVHRANDRLGELIEEDPSIDGTGTTVSAVLFDGAHIGLGHLGDSRGYLWRDGELLRITRDHTWVQSLVDEGRITEEESMVHSHRSLLLKVLDGRHDSDPDLTVYDVRAGDRILLCSDGLSGFVDQDRISRVLSIGSVSSVAAELVQLALEAASTDNITVVVADVVNEDGEHGGEPLVVGAAADPPRQPRSRLRTWAHRGAEVPGETLLADADDDPEELRYAPREPRRFRWLTRGLLFVVVAAIMGFGLKLAYDWTQTQYYVAADGDRVAIYRGVQAELPAIRLQQVYVTDDLTLNQLPTFPRSQVLEGMTADDLDDAHAIVERLRVIADTCVPPLEPSSTPTTKTSTPPPPPSSTATGSDRPADAKQTTTTAKQTTTTSTATTTPDPGGAGSEACPGLPSATQGTS